MGLVPLCAFTICFAFALPLSQVQALTAAERLSLLEPSSPSATIAQARRMLEVVGPDFELSASSFVYFDFLSESLSHISLVSLSILDLQVDARAAAVITHAARAHCTQL